MVQFNAGDKVRRTGDNFGRTVVGGIYTVLECREGNNLLIVEDPARYYCTDRFELAVYREEDFTFYTIVYKFNGAGPRVYSYTSLESAETAQRNMLADGRHEIVALKKIKVKI